MTTASKSAKKAKATEPSTKAAAKKSKGRKTAMEADQCWPGYKPVAGKMAGEKGSCEKKEKQTKSEKRADGKAAAASKLEKAGGDKAKANRS